jgi:hypothetical protein
MTDGEEKLKVIITPRFRFLGGGETGDLSERLPGIVTTELARSQHLVVVAREDAMQLLSQTIGRIAQRDYIEAHSGGTVNIQQQIRLSPQEIRELSNLLETDVKSRLMALGVGYLIYGKYFEARTGELRIDLYGLNVPESNGAKASRRSSSPCSGTRANCSCSIALAPRNTESRTWTIWILPGQDANWEWTCSCSANSRSTKRRTV